MKKKLMLFVGLLFFIIKTSAFASNVTNVQLTPKEKEFIKNHPTILLGTGDSWAPYSIKNQDGTISGYDQDILDRINRSTGANFVLKQGDWVKIQKLAKDKLIDGLSTLTITDKREEFLNFSNIYISLQKMVLVKQRNPLSIHTVKDLAGKTIVIHKGNVTDENIAKQFKDSKIIYAATPLDALKEVLYGKADVTFGNGATEYMLSKKGLPYMENAFTLDTNLDLAFAVRKDWSASISILNKGLSTISEHEKVALLNKWFFTKQKKIIDNILTLKEKAYLKQKKQITMCIDPDWMPFEKFDKKGNHIGMSADYFKIFQKDLGIPINPIKTKSWGESIEAAKSRECDIFSLAMETKERKEYMNFTTPYLSIPLVLATKLDVSFLNDFKYLKNEKIGIAKGYAFNEIIREKYPNINVVDVENLKDGLQKVANGELYGCIGTLASVGYMFQTEFIGELKITGKFDENWELGIGVRNDDLMLLNIFEKSIQNLSSVVKQDILSKHISITYAKGVDYKLLWQFAGVVFVLLLFFIYRQYILKKSNEKLQILVDIKTKELQNINENLEQKIIIEVTKSQKIEKRLFQSEKMASMGEMIGNIAHQWRQPLAIISMGANNIILDIDLDSVDHGELKENATKIVRQTHYLSKTIDDFKNFIKGERNKNIFNLKNNVKSFLHLVEGSVKKNNINIILDIKDDIEIDGYENELNQCFINIFNNSKDALIQKDENNRLIFISTSTKDNKIIIKIKDNAGGIQEAILPKIFEPYFTTKHQSQGTGLGLHMTYKLIVDGMNGTIDAKNVKYQYNDKDYNGAEFTITLPL